MRLPGIEAAAARLWFARNRRLQAAAVLCALLALTAAVLQLAVIRPLRADLRARETANAALRAKAAAAVEFQKQRNVSGGALFAVPAQRDMPLLVKELVQAARGSGLRVGAVKYDIPRAGAGGVAMLTFTFPVEGRYGDLKRLVHELETSRRLVGIRALEMKGGKNGVELAVKLVTAVKGQ